MNIYNVIRLLMMTFSFILLFDFTRVLGMTQVVENIQSISKGFLFLLSIFLFILYIKDKKKIFLSRCLFYLFVYLIFASISIIWSSSVTNTVIGIISFTGAMSICVLSIYALGINESIKYFFLGVEAIIVVSFCYLLTGLDVHSYTMGAERYVGITFGPHALSRAAGILLIYKIYGYLNTFNFRINIKLIYDILIVFIILHAMIYTDSRQVMLAVFLALIFLFWFSNKSYFLILAKIGITFVLSTLIIINDYSALESLFVRSNQAELTTMTGRTFIWEKSFELISNSPLLGYGFNAGGEILKNNYTTYFGWSTSSAHNALFHSLLDLGILGSFLLFYWFLYLSFFIYKTKNGFLIASFIFFFIICFVERVIAGNLSFGMFYLILLSSIFLVYKQNKFEVSV